MLAMDMDLIFALVATLFSGLSIWAAFHSHRQYNAALQGLVLRLDAMEDYGKKIAASAESTINSAKQHLSDMIVSAQDDIAQICEAHNAAADRAKTLEDMIRHVGERSTQTAVSQSQTMLAIDERVSEIDATITDIDNDLSNAEEAVKTLTTTIANNCDGYNRAISHFATQLGGAIDGLANAYGNLQGRVSALEVSSKGTNDNAPSAAAKVAPQQAATPAEIALAMTDGAAPAPAQPAANG